MEQKGDSGTLWGLRRMSNAVSLAVSDAKQYPPGVRGRLMRAGDQVRSNLAKTAAKTGPASPTSAEAMRRASKRALDT